MSDEPKNNLSKDSTITDIFNFVYDPDNDVQVLPVTISKKGDNIARMCILIQGKHDTASTIMANLMAYVEEMHKLAADVEAQKAANGEIIGTDGKPLEDEPKIELVS